MAQMVLNVVAEAFSISERLPLPLGEGEYLESTSTVAPPEWRELMMGNIAIARAADQQSTPDKTPGAKSGKDRAIFPGAFNPMHSAHLRMAEIAAQFLGMPVEFEISIKNVDKPPLDYEEIAGRSKQFTEKQLPLWLTRAPTFVEKAALFPGASFIVGADTLVRIGHCRYYDHNLAALDTAMEKIAQHGCRFLVFGRTVNGQFQSLAELELPTSLRRLCDEVPAAQFREDVSSTELRRGAM